MTFSLITKAAALGGIALAASATASAGSWQLNPNLCPDLVEDRIDRSITTSRADLREDYRDMSRVNCPASAWVYVPSAGERVRRAVRYTGPTAIYVGRTGYYTAPVRRGYRYRRPVRVNVRIG